MADLLQTLQPPLGSRYTLIRELGRGGMATVLLAEEHHPQRQVAVKVFNPALSSVVGQERFQREVEISARLSHPHIVPIFASGEAAGLLYYVMPYLTGESLRDRLEREGRLPVAEALAIGAEVADALDYAHRQGVIHRDIKPENILLQAGHALVADFGVARAVLGADRDRLTRTGVAVGTPLYMSPEQINGVHELDGRADVYSLACVLYEMLAGVPPFAGPTVEAVMMQQIGEAPPALRERRPDVSDDVWRLVARGLAKAPADRWPTAGDFAAALRAGAGMTSAEHLAARWRQPRLPWPLWVGALAVVVALILWQIAEHPRPRYRAAPRPSVAVLYFDNLSRDTADAYLADGLTEETIAKLGQIRRLVTASRAAVHRFHGTADPTAAARALGVAHLVTGSVRHSAHQLRVTVEMVGAATGEREWGEEYDRADGDVLALEEGVATEVAQAVVGALLPAERAALARRPTADRQAYDLFLHGNFDLAQRTPQSVARALAEYRGATARDPRFAAALARAALIHEFYLDYGWPLPAVPTESLPARGIRLADSALALDSTSSDAWMAQALLRSKAEPKTYSGVVAAFDRAIALDSGNAEALHQYGSTLRDLGRDSLAIAMSLRALAIEPARAITLVQLGLIAMIDRRLPDADRWLDSAVAVDPTFVFAYPFRSAVHVALGDTAQARADAESALQLSGGYRLPGEAALVILDAHGGRLAAARRRAATLPSLMLDARHPTVREGGYTAAALVAAGASDQALDVLERTRPRGIQLWAALRFPWFDPIRDHSRFQRLVAESQPPLAP
ncbi:MAG: protein kinase [Gemmatimonadales bacterium]